MSVIDFNVVFNLHTFVSSAECDWCLCCREEVREVGFTVVIDMRGSTWSTVKPILKVLQEHFANSVHVAYIIKPDNFWQKQRTSLGSHKYKFEVGLLSDEL